MTPRLLEARYVKNYVLHLRFADGREGDVDLEPELHGEIFEALRDPSSFKKFRMHPELHTVTWSNGADFAPEFLYNILRVPA
jgi:hypothetical protein